MPWSEAWGALPAPPSGEERAVEAPGAGLGAQLPQEGAFQPRWLPGPHSSTQNAPQALYGAVKGLYGGPAP